MADKKRYQMKREIFLKVQMPTSLLYIHECMVFGKKTFLLAQFPTPQGFNAQKNLVLSFPRMCPL